ncbi:MAG: hypothetical protein N2039_10520 [Gemmataceae bacterium]|nr:hypothetical protein [Gemmataceae bacterium]
MARPAKPDEVLQHPTALRQIKLPKLSQAVRRSILERIAVTPSIRRG